MWRRTYQEPSIENVTIDRCDQNGDLNDDGKYFRATFDWALGENTEGAVKQVSIAYKLTTSTSWSNNIVTASGTSGSVDKIIGFGLLSTENTYDICITVSDNTGSTEYYGTLPATKYIIDFSPQGGVGFGRPAPAEQTVSFNVPMVIDGIDMFFKSGFYNLFDDMQQIDKNLSKILSSPFLDKKEYSKQIMEYTDKNFSRSYNTETVYPILMKYGLFPPEKIDSRIQELESNLERNSIQNDGDYGYYS